MKSGIAEKASNGLEMVLNGIIGYVAEQAITTINRGYFKILDKVAPENKPSNFSLSDLLIEDRNELALGAGFLTGVVQDVLSIALSVSYLRGNHDDFHTIAAYVVGSKLAGNLAMGAYSLGEFLVRKRKSLSQ